MPTNTTKVKGRLDFITKLRGVVVDPDQDGSDNYKVRLAVTKVQQAGVPTAVVVYDSNPTGGFSITGGVDDVPTREAEGIFTFYGIDSNVNSDTTGLLWDVSQGGPLQPGVIHDFKWDFRVDSVTYTKTRRWVWADETPNFIPAKHAYTLLDLKNVITNFLGSDPGSDNVTNLVNDALMLVWSSHTWSFSSHDTAYLDTVAGQDYCVLPENFLRELGIERAGDLTHGMVKVTGRDMLRLREASTTTPTLRTYYYINMNPVRDMSDVPTFKMEIFPTPATSRPRVYALEYERTPPALIVDGAYPAVPLGMAPLLKQACRAVAAADESDVDGSLEMSKYYSLLPQYVRMDDRRTDTVHLGQFGDRRYGAAGDTLFPIDPQSQVTLPDL